MKILQLISINHHILLVFYNPGSCYQFSLITPDGFFYQSKDIFSTPLQAEREGRKAIEIAASFFGGYRRQSPQSNS